MKKTFKVFLIMIGCLLLSACSKGSYKEVTYEELMNKFSNKDSFIITLEAGSCINCDMFKDTITDIIKKYNVTIYYIDLDKVNDAEYGMLKSMFDFTGTPTTINIVEGKENTASPRIRGRSDYLEIKNRLISWGYIKE